MSPLTPLSVAVLGSAAFVAAVIGVAVVRRWATGHGILDVPNERSSHTRQTPRGGGLAVVGIITLGVAIAGSVGLVQVTRALAFFGGGALLVAVVSWLNGLRALPVATRFSAHVSAALLMTIGLGFKRLSPLPPGRALGTLVALAVALLWIVGLTNAFNFMDGIDGIAGSQGAIAGLAWMAFGLYTGSGILAVVGVMMCGSCLGFLVHNWSPAKIFMGDLGSAFLGFTFAVLALFAAPYDRCITVAHGFMRR